MMPRLNVSELTTLMEKINIEIGWGRSGTGYSFDPKTGAIWDRNHNVIHDGDDFAHRSNIRIPFVKYIRAAYDKTSGLYLGFYRNADPLNPIIEVLPCLE